MKATQEAIALGRWVSASEDIDTALAGWAREVAHHSDEAYLLGRSVGDALVTNSPDWTRMDADDVLAYWGAATRGRKAHYLDSSADQAWAGTPDTERVTARDGP